MKQRLLAIGAVAMIGLLAGCSGGSNSSAGPVTPPVVVPPPPPANTRFEVFLFDILARTNETESPFAVNDMVLTFDETPGIFARVTGN